MGNIHSVATHNALLVLIPNKKIYISLKTSALYENTNGCSIF